MDGDQATGQVGEEAAVVVPVAVILVPLPGAADVRLLQDHLVMVVVDLAAEEELHGVDDPPAADERRVDVVVQVVVDRELDHAPLAVATACRLVGHPVVGAGDLAQQIDLLGVEEALRDEVAILVEPSDLLFDHTRGGHRVYSPHQTFETEAHRGRRGRAMPFPGIAWPCSALPVGRARRGFRWKPGALPDMMYPSTRGPVFG